MDPTVAGLVGAGIGALSGMIGTVIGQAMQSRREHKKWQLGKKEEAYSNSLRFLLKVLNRRSQITGDGKTFISKDDLPAWFQDVVEAQAWLASLTIFCASSVRHRLSEVSKKLNDATSRCLGIKVHIGNAHGPIDIAEVGKIDSDFAHLSTMVAEAYSEVLACATQELGKHVE